MKYLDNVETKGLLPTIQNFLKSISLPFEASKEIEALEFISRDGFSAHDHNRGGMDLFSTTTVAYLIGSGEHCGTAIELDVEDSWDSSRNDIIKDNPELDLEGDELFDRVYESCNDDYSGMAYRVRVMYEGNGVLCVYSGYDTDAPYYRWNNKPDFNTKVKFKTKTELKRKLKALVKRIEKSQ